MQAGPLALLRVIWPASRPQQPFHADTPAVPAACHMPWGVASMKKTLCDQRAQGGGCWQRGLLWTLKG